MTLGYRIAKLRRENNHTQEQLAELLGVSRQAVSRWESDAARPETDKLIRLSRLYGCTLDYLLVGESEPVASEAQQATPGRALREQKSERMLFGMPLWHVARDARGFVAVGLRAQGVIAIGLRAQGAVALGLFALGILPLGMLSIGLLAFGLFAVGLLSAGCIALGVCAAGAVSFGIFTLGAVAIGDFSAGALAVGRYVAVGDNARAMVALGDTQAVGSVYQHCGAEKLSPAELEAVRAAIDGIVPARLRWAAEMIQIFIN